MRSLYYKIHCIFEPQYYFANFESIIIIPVSKVISKISTYLNLFHYLLQDCIQYF